MNSPPLARLLIVDDEQAQVAALCHTLKAEGYATTGTGSGPEALAALRAAVPDPSAAFDILITDLMMPHMDGIALLRAAGEIDRDLVSIVMTGHGTIDTAVEAMKSGALDYIEKPFNLNGIMPVLARARAVRSLRRANAALLQRVAEHTAELEATNRELQAANRELETFTQSVSHDLRQPLNAMIGFAEFLESGKPGALNPTQKGYVTDIRNSGLRLLRLTDDLLHFARLGQRPLARQEVDVSHLVQEVLRELAEAEPGRGLELRVGNLPAAWADPALLRQVFVNLFSNAYKFTRHTAGARIEIEGERRGGECLYSVQDNGAGFDMRHAEKLFTIFHRLHSATAFEGSGVGLSIVKRIVERHGGGISAQAQVGQGARFTFTMPWSARAI